MNLFILTAKDYGVQNLPWWIILIIAGAVFIVALLLPWKRWKRKIFAKKNNDKMVLTQKSKLVKVKSHSQSCQKCQIFENQILDIEGVSTTHQSWKSALNQGFKHEGCTHEVEAWSE